MLRNYILIAFRNLVRQKLYSVINIIGLAVGIALFTLITLFIIDQLSYDKFNENFNRIYRLEYGEWSILGPAYGPLVEEGIPSIIAASRVDMMYGRSKVIRVDDKLTKLEGLILADTGFIDIFSLEFLSGDPSTALTNPNSILLSEETARKLYGDQNPMGRSLRYDNRFNLIVKGVYRIPGKFHITANAIAPFMLLTELYGQEYLADYGSWNYNTYTLLPEEHNQSKVEEEVRQFFYNHFADDSQRQHLAEGFFLRPLKEIYFANHLKYEMDVKHGNLQNLKLFFLVAMFILLLACINFINLTTARGAMRAKEVGLRKVIGSHRTQLIFQFLSETILVALMSLVIALLLIEMLLPEFIRMTGSQLSFNYGIENLAIMIVAVILVGAIAGIYPAFYLTSFDPIMVLRGEKTKGKAAVFFRRFLIVLQFGISIVLITGTITIHRQLAFMKEKNPGFDKENIIWFQLSRSFNNKEETFRQMLLQYPFIKDAAISHQIPGHVKWQESIRVNGEIKQFTFWPVTPEYIDMMGFEFTEGRNFRAGSQADHEHSYILNEEAVRFFGWENPLEENFDSQYLEGRVIGVVKDFHFNTLQQPIGPLVLVWRPRALNMMNVRFAETEMDKVLGILQTEWEKISPDFPFEYAFLDESFDQHYKKEEQFGRTFIYFSLLTIFIAGLGLFGLSSYTTVQRTREIGIRKVFGAGENAIIVLLIKDFIRWVALANLIAWPFAWYAIEHWLEMFPYRINQSVWIYLSAAILAITIAIATVGMQALKAARANPVDSLKYE